MSQSTQFSARAESLIEALPYIQNFRGQTFVIKYGGSAMEDDQVIDRLLKDIVFLEAVGINPVLVHGGGRAITKRLQEGGIRSSFVQGLRITNAETIRVVQEILDEHVNPHIVRTLSAFGGRAHGISGTEIFVSRRLQPLANEAGDLVDIGFVGEVLEVRTEAICRDIRKETVSVISPLAKDAEGQVLNVNADTAAAAIASSLKASKIVYLSDVPGIMRNQDDPESLIPTVNPEMIARLTHDKILSGGMLPKVQSALRAIESGVNKVHFIDGRIAHGLLLEVFTNAGVGTEIIA